MSCAWLQDTREPDTVRPVTRRTTLLAIAATAVIGVVLRLHFLDVPLNTDEGGFAAIARLWREGYTLYGNVAWVDRPQGLLVLYRLAGLADSDQAIRALAIARLAGHPGGRRRGRLGGRRPGSRGGRRRPLRRALARAAPRGLHGQRRAAVRGAGGGGRRAGPVVDGAPAPRAADRGGVPGRLRAAREAVRDRRRRRRRGGRRRGRRPTAPQPAGGGRRRPAAGRAGGAACRDGDGRAVRLVVRDRRLPLVDRVGRVGRSRQPPAPAARRHAAGAAGPGAAARAGAARLPARALAAARRVARRGCRRLPRRRPLPPALLDPARAGAERAGRDRARPARRRCRWPSSSRSRWR